MTALDVHYITVEEENKLHLDHVILIVWTNRRLVSSVGRAPVYWAGGRGFKPRPDQHSGSLNDWGESAAFVIISANG